LDSTDSFDFRSHLRNHDHRDSVRQAAHEVGNLVAGALWEGSVIKIKQGHSAERKKQGAH
jgi:hypothetical protein